MDILDYHPNSWIYEDGKFDPAWTPGNKKLSDDDVRLIKRMLAHKKELIAKAKKREKEAKALREEAKLFTQEAIAEEFGVYLGTIEKIGCGKHRGNV